MRISPPLEDKAGKSRRVESRKRQDAPVLPTAASLYVPHLPGLAKDSRLSLYVRSPSEYEPLWWGDWLTREHQAGNLPSTPATSQSDAHLYFLLALNRHIPNRQRLLIWLNGGPGCSSFDGALLEVGPVRIQKDGTVEEVHNTAWNEYANVLFLDQPAGTGFSYVTQHDDVRELAEAADQVVTFLSNLYQVFPEFVGMDTYIAGESYAGQYIPYIADAILKTTTISTRLKGLMIGNGWISPREQYPAYLEYLVQRGLVKTGSQQYKRVEKKVETCLAEMVAMDKKQEGSKGMVLIGVCEEILSAINAVTQKDGQCLNAYDTTKYQACGAQWPEQLAEVTPYLRRPAVIKALHAEAGMPKQWEQCSGTVGSHFWTPNSVPAVLLLPHLLETVPILLFAGERDLMCAGVGIDRMIEKLDWNGEVGFGDAVVQDWTVDSVLSGTWTTARGLSYVNVYNASHMVPIDVPTAAHDMLLRFMGVDTLHAAGHAAKVPSRIGKETEAVLGATQPDGSTLKENEAAAAAALAAGKTPSGGKDVTQDGFDRDHERIYGPRRTAVLFFLLALAGVGVWGFFRWRAGRRKERYRRKKGKGRAGGIRLSPNSRALEEGRPEVAYQEPESLETTPVFDVGEDDDFEEERYREEDGEEEEEEEEPGDLGRTANPWQEGQEARE